MTENRSYDLIIAGAGAAGLSLAWYLMKSEWIEDRNVLLIDQSLSPTDEKTWCFWDDQHLPMSDLIYHSWNRLSVIAHGETFEEELQNYQYRCMRSLDYSREILKQARAHPSFTLMEADVNSFDEENSRGVVRTSEGEFRADWVFQSIFRSPEYKFQKSDVSLKQHFLGVEIETNHPIFDPDHVTLMDFDTSQKHGFTFFYILPFAENKALVEYTFFTEDVLPYEEYKSGITTYLKERYGLDPADYSITREEQGAIPMEDRHYPSWYNSRVLNIGTVGGMTKPSTGYTFTRIHRHCADIVTALENGNTPPASNASSYRFRVYDIMLLSILEKEPLTAVTIFRELFKRNRFDTILLFLEEKTHPGTEIGIFSSLPYMPFFKSINDMKHRIFTGA